eukprot:CAMPEP_0172535598 /NCGR_PEP_ID=MMETSP1067-20121228/7531_1 /TAXON_ID=265564 ORGANISM="Thalassiosira punctigera, Strain Tpunct2005C2" /NCGR_SAMPLE_ID=MMETSP1067 /ASSEMBLY_ACC=CAM_ASM_000444 /LENGTH=411 /DNA_ID=CAMNT_0013320537 /DNA_START=23 /DNA_END=1258 /DNA_ORIENTATION=-
MRSSPLSSLSAAAVLCASLLSGGSGVEVEAFSPTTRSSVCRASPRQRLDGASPVAAYAGTKTPPRPRSVLFQSDDDNAVAEMTELEAARTRETPKLAAEDESLVRSIYAACGGNDDAMENAITANLENMHPRLVVALQIAAEKGEWKREEEGRDSSEEFETQMVALGGALQSVLDVRLKSGRELLAELLGSGEIRKLDSALGKAAREGRLDMSFFTVLGMNMKDAALNDSGESNISLSPTLAAGEGQPEVEGEDARPASANRLQILQHVYTRAQEELEKNVAPGMGLLNKLLRTEISSIRKNQLDHYLCPQKTSITSPDGKTIDLGTSGAPLVGHAEFTEALSNTVRQIRTLEAAGGTDRLSATNLIENVRQVAMEARMALAEGFGEGSDELNEFQRELQPVFRPGSNLES